MNNTDTTTEAPSANGDAEAGAVELAPQVQTPEAPILGDLSVVPAQHELQAMFQLANVFAASSLVPKDLRQSPNNCLLVMMTARELGLSFTVAFRECHVIDGKVTTSPKLRKAIVHSRGLGKIWPDPDNDEHSATWYARRADDPEVLYASTFTWKDAQRPDGRNRLVGKNCTPDEHRPNRDGKCGCKDNWRNYPQRQLAWRAQGYLLDDAFPEVGTGLYDADELGAVTDQDGRPVIDVGEVGVPEGMQAPRGQRRAQQPQGPTPADSDELAELVDRIKALPASALDALKERWAQPRSAESGGGPMLPVDSDGKPAARLLTASSIKAARALVGSFEKDVAAGRYQDSGDADDREAPVPEERMQAEPAATTGHGDQPPPSPEQPRSGIKPSQTQMAKLHALLKDKRNATEATDRHAVLSELTGREIASASDLSASEVRSAIDALDSEPDWGDSA